MSLAFTGPSGTVEHRWIVYALLRDNIQHHLEGAAAAGDFEGVHAIDATLGGRLVTVNVLRLRGELERASVLLGRPIGLLAISSETLLGITAGDRTGRGRDRRQLTVPGE